MNASTPGERAFVEFCTAHGIPFEHVQTGSGSTSDFRVLHSGTINYFEVKDIEDDMAFDLPVGQRTVGEHLRKKIKKARSQVQAAAETGHRSVLLVFNALDPLQIFGTEPTDFAAAMDGEFTVDVSPGGSISEGYHGRNRMFREDSKTAFSGLAHIYRGRSGCSVTIYANRHARHPLVEGGLPAPFRVHFCSPLDAPWVLG
jgi:hypothetical protein